MNNLRIEKLREKIIAHIQNGGSIYDKKNNLPYYEYLRSIKRDLAEELGREVAFEEVYELCGFNFDREYYETSEEYKRFIVFFEKVKSFADQNGYVDEMRNSEIRQFDNTYEQLKNYADKYNCAPFDFLVLMTGFKFKKALIPVDYVSFLSQQLKTEYPDGNIEGIRWNHPDLYEAIRHLRRYLPEQLSMQDVAEFLGVYNNKFSKTILSTKVNSKNIIEEILKVCPDRNVTHLRHKNLQLYYKVIEISRLEDKLPNQWFRENNFTFDFNMNTSRLSKASVNTDLRASKLLALREKFLEQFDLTQMDEIDKYRLAIEILKKVIVQVENENYADMGVEYIKDSSLDYERISSPKPAQPLDE